MSKRKGVSAEEKRTRMLEIFHESQEFYHMKELEKIAPKQKGIVLQSVKDVVQSLVDDGLVEAEKIGTSIWYWSYPDKALHALNRDLEKLEQKSKDTKNKIELAQEELKKFMVGREPSAERTKLLEKLHSLQEEVKETKAELAKHQENDPAIWQERKKRCLVARDAANRWTDNIFAIKSWVKNKFNIDEATINKQFGIPEELEYME